MLVLLYFALTLLVLYTEAVDCLTNKYKFKLKEGLFFSLLWPISLTYSIYIIWKELK